MTSLLEGAKKLVTRGTDIGARIEGLDAATYAARGRLDDSLVAEAQAVVDRAILEDYLRRVSDDDPEKDQ